MEQICKYPRTRHLEGSRLQPGDQDLEQVAWPSLADRHLVIEEKVDGANAGISFTAGGELRLQSRGHYLEGGGRERHFALFKTWAARHRAASGLRRTGARRSRARPTAGSSRRSTVECCRWRRRTTDRSTPAWRPAAPPARRA